MGLDKFETWRASHNMLKLNLLELSLADFVWHGRNTYTWNRCFLVLEGTGRILNHTGNESFDMQPGSAFFMPEYLDLEFDFPPGLRFLCWRFKLELLPGIDAFRGVRKCSSFPVPTAETEQYRALLSTNFNWKRLCEFECSLWMLLRHLDFPEDNDPTRLALLRKRYGKLLAFVRDSPSAQLDLDQLAAISGMSRDTLSRRFSRDFGLPLKTFLMRELVSATERHLLTGELSIQEIADRFQFSSPFYFSRFFKRHKGLSPSEFRRRNRVR